MNHTRLIISAVLALGITSAVAEVDLTKLPPASTQKDITYAKDIKPLFEASCFGCHGEKKQKGDIRLDSLEAVLKGGEEGKIVEVGDALKSHLLISISHLDPKTAMPPKPKASKPAADGSKKPADANKQPPAKPLTADQVGLVRAWIDQGLK